MAMCRLADRTAFLTLLNVLVVSVPVIMPKSGSWETFKDQRPDNSA